MRNRDWVGDVVYLSCPIDSVYVRSGLLAAAPVIGCHESFESA